MPNQLVKMQKLDNANNMKVRSGPIQLESDGQTHGQT